MKKIIAISLLLIAILAAGYVSFNHKEVHKIINEGKAFYSYVLKYKSTDIKNKKANKKKAVMASRYVFPTEEPVRAVPGKHTFLVRVKIGEQKVNVYEDNVKIRTMKCSTGLQQNDDSTPIGHFKINGYYGQSFYNAKYKEGARYWVGFINGKYLFHSIPVEKDGEVIASEARKIGYRASHGCIRLTIKDAYWFYQTVPQGADVIIER